MPGLELGTGVVLGRVLVAATLAPLWSVQLEIVDLRTLPLLLLHLGSQGQNHVWISVLYAWN